MAEQTVTQNGLVYTLSDDGSYYSVNADSLIDDLQIETYINGIPVVPEINDIELVDSTTVGAEEDFEFDLSSEIVNPVNDDYEVLSFIGQNDVKYAIVTYLPTNDTFAAAIGAYDTAENIVIDSVVGNYTVKMIDGGAFTNCTLLSVTIPDGVTRIGMYAFANCSELTSITIPDSVTSIGNCAFLRCSKLTSVTIGNGVTAIGWSVFSSCSGLTSVTIGNGVTSIGDEAFSGCSALTSITIPNSVTSIEINAFSRCTELTSITVDPDNTVYKSDGNCLIIKATNTLILGCKTSIIPDYVTSIGDSAFYYCSGLTSITIGDGVTSIRQGAFSNCTALKTVILGKGLETLYGTSNNNGSFRNCTALTTVINKSDNLVTPNNTYVFYGCSKLTKVYYTSTTAGYVNGGKWCNRTLEYLNWNGEDSLMLNATADNIALPTDSNGKTSMTVKSFTDA